MKDPIELVYLKLACPALLIVALSVFIFVRLKAAAEQLSQPPPNVRLCDAGYAVTVDWGDAHKGDAKRMRYVLIETPDGCKFELGLRSDGIVVWRKVSQ